MTTLETLTAEIQKLVPEILELSFGCEIITGNPYPVTHIIRRMSFESVFDDDAYTKDGHTGKWINVRPGATASIVKILGHPITLEHCRIAIRRHFKPPLSPTNDPDHPLIALHYAWKDLEPWESQTEVHTVIEKYLLTK